MGRDVRDGSGPPSRSLRWPRRLPGLRGLERLHTAAFAPSNRESFDCTEFHAGLFVVLEEHLGNHEPTKATLSRKRDRRQRRRIGIGHVFQARPARRQIERIAIEIESHHGQESSNSVRAAPR